MKIFGHYIFEDDPEVKALREAQEKKRLENIIRGCKEYGSKKLTNFIAWEFTEIPNGDYIYGDQLTLDTKEHRELVKKRECHVFYGKKYCYHTGEKIITEI